MNTRRFFAALLISSTTTSLFADNSTSEVIDLLSTFEAQFESYQWKYSKTRAAVPEGSDLSSVTAEEVAGWSAEGDYSAAGEICYHISTGRFRVVARSTRPWSAGAAPFASRQQAWSFDGEVHRQWMKEAHGTIMPEVTSSFSDTSSPLVGSIKMTPDDETMLSLALRDSGIHNLPPFVDVLEKGATLSRMSQVLSEAQAAASTQTEETEGGVNFSTTTMPDGKWKIEVPSNTDENVVITMRVDPERGGAIEEMTWRTQGSETPYIRAVFLLREVVEGVWLPEQFTSLRVFDKIAYRTTLTDIEVNPAIPDEEYALEMPEGAIIDDFVEKHTYTVGAGSQGDTDAVRAFLEKYELRDAVKNAVSAPKAAPSSRKWISFGSLLVIGVVFVLAFWRHRSSASISKIVVLVAFGMGAGEVSAKIEFQKGSWVVRHGKSSSSKGFPINQCGFNVAVLAFELFDRDYEPDAIASSLEPTADGTLYSDLVGLLKGAGLKVDVRKNVSIADLNSSLPMGTLAVFPVELPHGAHHYLACMRNSDGKCVIVDAPLNVTPVSNFDLTKLSAQYKELLVAFVSMPAGKKTAINSLVRISSPTIDIGVIHLKSQTNQRKRSAEFRIKNVSDSPVLVSRVKKSCGCTATSWSGGLILPRDSIKIALEVDTHSWGYGEVVKQLTLFFADGSTNVVRIVGTGVTPEVAQHLKVVPHAISIDVDTRLGHGGFQETYAAAIMGSGVTAEAIKIESNKSWITSELVVGATGDHTLEVAVNLNDEDVKSLATATTPLTGGLSVSAFHDRPPVEVTLTLVPRKFFSMSKRVIDVKKNGEEVGIEILSSDLDSSGFRITDKLKTPDGLELESVESADGTLQLLVRAEETIRTGLHPVKVLIESKEGRVGVASFVVKVRS